MKLKRSQLMEASEELNELLFEEGDKQRIDGNSVEELSEQIKEAAELIDPEQDEITEDTVQVLKNLDVWELPEKEEPEKEEQTEDAEVVPETDPLVEEIEDAERLKDLRDIAKANDEFKEIRGKLTKWKDEEDLRGVMLEILEGPGEEKEPEEAPKEKPAPKEKEAPKAKMEVVKGGKSEKTEKKPAKKKKGTGVIASVVEAIEKAGKKGVSKEEILKILVEKFPDRAEKSMKNTVGVQVPGRISRERFEVKSTKDGKYYKA